MSEHVITKEKMESLKALTDVNLKISEAFSTLSNLKQEETKYFKTREIETLNKVRQVLSESKELLRECDENHSQIQELLIGVTDFASKLTELHEWLQGLIGDFDERNKLWNTDMNRQQESIVKMRNEIKLERQIIENDKKSLKNAEQKLSNDQKKLESDRGTVQRTIERLKINRI